MNKKNIHQVVIAVLVLLTVCLLFGTKKEDVRFQVEYVFLGDSILGGVRNETSIPILIGEALDKNVANCAFGGTTTAKLNMPDTEYAERNGLVLWSLASAIATNDFGVQKAMHLRENVAADFKVTVDGLSMVDFDNVEVLFMEYGTNDYNNGVPIENEADPYDEYTTKGAIRSSLSMIQKAYPDLRIIMVGPMYAWFVSEQATCEDMNFGQGTLADYIEAMQDIAKEYDVEFIDLYNLLPHEEFADWELYTEDGLHPNQAGRELFAKEIIAYMQANP